MTPTPASASASTSKDLFSKQTLSSMPSPVWISEVVRTTKTGSLEGPEFTLDTQTISAFTYVSRFHICGKGHSCNDYILINIMTVRY